ncbi:pyridoxamine 5'-phosphate oxidase-like protein [Streptomyces sp. TLI_55]|uniref:pyridoxamine 5'-phosphate oxidase family protein n=1 Tax=Streptomyces sp. TLI_55 TaxID=1938861 RepID=UPI000BD06E84|nr:pyridoxamine 5'-phosphate oxidase family protein [Streptomyces sp. TLI_55]SNX62551.1 pyridoxamine 5'-phosphate oxidase-like protein [Streptomyces sp. TLI_55]
MPSEEQLSDEQLAVDLLARTDYGRVATSMRALPFLAFARHIVADGRVLLRLPGNVGYHRACVGHVVAYGADNLSSARPGEGLWSVQVVGACARHEPTPAELERFGPGPNVVDGEPYEPVYLRVEPQFGTVHSTDGALESHFAHLP